MFGSLNTKTSDVFDTANSAVAGGVESTMNGIGTSLGNSLSDAQIQVQSIPAFLNMGSNGFDELTMTDFADAFQNTNSGITAVTQVTAPESSLGQQFGAGEQYPSMDFAPNFSIYGTQVNAWFNSSTNVGGVNGDYENWTANVGIDQNGLHGDFTMSVKQGPLTVFGQLMWFNSQLTTSYISIDYVLPGQEFHATRQWSPSNELEMNCAPPVTTIR